MTPSTTHLWDYLLTACRAVDGARDTAPATRRCAAPLAIEDPPTLLRDTARMAVDAEVRSEAGVAYLELHRVASLSLPPDQDMYTPLPQLLDEEAATLTLSNDVIAACKQYAEEHGLAMVVSDASEDHWDARDWLRLLGWETSMYYRYLVYVPSGAQAPDLSNYLDAPEAEALS